MERIVTEHEIKGEHKIISVKEQTYVTLNGIEKPFGVPHRPPRHFPGTLVEGVYVKTDLKTLDADVKVLASHFWTQDVHDLFEELLKEQQVKIDSLGS